MIEYLEQLVEERKFREAVDFAERLLSQQSTDEYQNAKVYCTILALRLILNEFEGAASIGPAAVSLCEQIGAWNLFGNACVDLGAALYCLNRVGEAEEVWNRYLAHMDLYEDAARFEGRVWYNLAKVNADRHHMSAAVWALTQALDAANRSNNHREAHGFRQALIETSLQAGQVEQVPRMLAKALHYLRTYPDHDSLLWHYKLRGDFAFYTRRFHRALAIGVRGLVHAEGEPIHQYSFHMQLGRVMVECGRRDLALGHLLSARYYALACHRADLATAPSDIVHEMLQCEPDLLVKIESTQMAPDFSAPDA